jgi:hypothetical protein
VEANEEIDRLNGLRLIKLGLSFGTPISWYWPLIKENAHGTLHTLRSMARMILFFEKWEGGVAESVELFCGVLRGI